MVNEREILKISQDSHDEHLAELTYYLAGYYVAFVGEKLVAFHQGLGILARAVYQSFRQRPIFMDRVEPLLEIPQPTRGE